VYLAGITNIVFNKVVGSLQNIASSKNIETRLKKWRSGIEAVISNIKRGFNLACCTWKGWEHFVAKVLWSVIAYNIRIMAAQVALRI
jgi:IS5 family transposase